MTLRPSPTLDEHPDRILWNEKYRRGRDPDPTFAPHPWIVEILDDPHLPDGPVLELASGPSGTALALARARPVTAIDVSDVALAQLAAESVRRGLRHQLTLLHTDLTRWTPTGPDYALVSCCFFWSTTVFRQACRAVAPGGVLVWEVPVSTPQHPSHVPPRWCARPEEPASLLPADFTVHRHEDLPRGTEMSRRLVARRHSGHGDEGGAGGGQR
ncbi:class I SAM-dependent methyltransferase [Rhodococcus cerastii]|nr:class I SAM-dependent methyltransferase [Rhodococcus cerastii]